MKATESAPLWELIEKAHEKITEGEAFPILPALARPIALPTGWRLPFDLYYKGQRIRQRLVVAFIHTQGGVNNIEIEYDDRHTDPCERKKLENVFALLPRSHLPSLHKAERFASEYIDKNDSKEKANEKLLIRYEAVIDLNYNSTDENRLPLKYPLCWRLEIRTLLRLYRVIIGLQPPGACESLPGTAQGETYPDEHTPLVCRDFTAEFARGVSTTANRNFSLPRAVKAVPPLSFNANERLRARAVLKANVDVSMCLNHVNYVLEGLRFSPLPLQSVAFQHHPTEMETAGAKCIATGNQVEISFPLLAKEMRKRLTYSSQTKDPSIIYHELGHVLLRLMYTKLPPRVAGTAAACAIEEGFCDYFAAMMMTQFPEIRAMPLPQIIGGRMKPFIVDGVGDGRYVTGEPATPEQIALVKSFGFSCDETSVEKYIVGSLWANLLWDLRKQLTSKVSFPRADQIILYAHIKPHFTIDLSAEPSIVTTAKVFNDYLDSLRLACQCLEGAPLLLEPHAWKTLKSDHGLDWI